MPYGHHRAITYGHMKVDHAHVEVERDPMRRQTKINAVVEVDVPDDVVFDVLEPLPEMPLIRGLPKELTEQIAAQVMRMIAHQAGYFPERQKQHGKAIRVERAEVITLIQPQAELEPYQVLLETNMVIDPELVSEPEKLGSPYTLSGVMRRALEDHLGEVVEGESLVVEDQYGVETKNFIAIDPASEAGKDHGSAVVGHVEDGTMFIDEVTEFTEDMYEQLKNHPRLGKDGLVIGTEIDLHFLRGIIQDPKELEEGKDE
jgi:hypothetical protein